MRKNQTYFWNKYEFISWQITQLVWCENITSLTMTNCRCWCQIINDLFALSSWRTFNIWASCIDTQTFITFYVLFYTYFSPRNKFTISLNKKKCRENNLFLNNTKINFQEFLKISRITTRTFIEVLVIHK